MAVYTFLNHVEYEVIGDEEDIGEEADDIIRRFFQSHPAAWNRAVSDESMRYHIVQNGDGVEILEEEGNWESGSFDPEGNDFELIYEENGIIRNENVSEEKAEAYIL